MEVNVVLFGFKGCGKSHFGKLLSEALHCDFVDTDQLIEALHGTRTCREIVEQAGEAAFRALESQVIASLPQTGYRVISVGGGAILDPHNCRRLEELGTLVYLEAGKDLLKKRVLSAGVPSYLDAADFDDSFEKMYLERRPIYESCAQVKIVTDEKNDMEVLTELVALIDRKNIYGT